MQSEWRWFGATLGDSLLRPRRFASTLGREHYGLAGVLVVFVAGIALSPRIPRGSSSMPSCLVCG